MLDVGFVDNLDDLDLFTKWGYIWMLLSFLLTLTKEFIYFFGWINEVGQGLLLHKGVGHLAASPTNWRVVLIPRYLWCGYKLL